MKKFLNEFQVFMQYPRDMRKLLITNMLYAWVLPIVEIFVGAYIMRSCGKPSYVAMFQLAMYAGIVFTSVINGWLLKKFNVAWLYCVGILFSSISMVGMMMLDEIGILQLIPIGFVMGAASGFFWTNRYLITLNSTDDSNRNYFFGLESLGFTVGNICVPMIVGAVIANLSGKEWLGITFDVTATYRLVTVVATVISLIACANILSGHYVNPEKSKFLYGRFDRLWNKMLCLSALKGMVQGFLVTAPAILVMKLIGDEGTLGVIQSVSGGLTAILVYILGRVTKPKHRIIVFSFGLSVFFLGTLVNCFWFSATGALVFILCKVMFQPLHDLAYFPIMMRTIDVVSKKEGRNEYTYILSHEIGLFIGRAFGLLLFLTLAFGISEVFALKFALPIVGGLQMLSIPLARNIIGDCDRNG